MSRLLKLEKRTIEQSTVIYNNLIAFSYKKNMLEQLTTSFTAVES